MTQIRDVSIKQLHHHTIKVTVFFLSKFQLMHNSSDPANSDEGIFELFIDNERVRSLVEVCVFCFLNHIFFNLIAEIAFY